MCKKNVQVVFTLCVAFQRLDDWKYLFRPRLILCPSLLSACIAEGVCVCVCVWKRAQEGSKRIMVPHTSYVSDWDKGPLGSMQRCVFVYVWIVCLCVWPSLSLYTHSLSLDLFTVSPHTHACRITAYLRHDSFTQRHSDTGTVRQLSDWPAASRHFQYVFYCYDMKSFSKSLKKYRFFFLKLFFLIWLRPLSYNVLDPGQFELIQWNV